ncbi:MAG: NYN domain-containing protein [Candidatus Dadabacteria bacterium]|nr:MAG: NYN domain-containing protein [Candidatus Dadabacteria bacterium]
MASEQTIIKRRQKTIYGIFIDGIALDRAGRRIGKKVSLDKLVSTLAPTNCVVKRYYTVIPHQDDARHLSFIDSIRNRGFRVTVKRLLPKNVERTVTADVEIASDIIAFAYTNPSVFDCLDVTSSEKGRKGGIGKAASSAAAAEADNIKEAVYKKIVIVCPSGELYYPVNLIRHNCKNAEIIAADFGKFSNRNIIAIAHSWFDLSDSQTIWKE